MSPFLVTEAFGFSVRKRTQPKQFNPTISKTVTHCLSIWECLLLSLLIECSKVLTVLRKRLTHRVCQKNVCNNKPYVFGNKIRPNVTPESTTCSNLSAHHIFFKRKRNIFQERRKMFFYHSNLQSIVQELFRTFMRIKCR